MKMASSLYDFVVRLTPELLLRTLRQRPKTAQEDQRTLLTP